MKNYTLLINGFKRAGYAPVRMYNTWYLTKAGCPVLELVFNGVELACIMQGDKCLWKARGAARA